MERREASLKAADAALNQAKAQSQAQGNQAGYARLTASHAGVITAVEAEVGQVVSAGQPVVRLAHDGPRDAVFAVSESAILSIRLGQSMQVTVLKSGQKVQGTVREIAASADPVTSIYAVKLALAPGMGESLPLRATLNVRASGVSGPLASAIKLPTSALRQEWQGTVVWVLDEANKTVNSHEVPLGPVDGKEVVVSFLALGQHKRPGNHPLWRRWTLDLRPGLVVDITIPLMLVVTFLAMYYFGIGLHKILLDSLIIAWGLLVDDAIIAVEMMVRKMEEGYDRVRSATFAYELTAMPMLTGTLITAAGFLPIGMAKSMTGEYTFAIFAVTVEALLVSWVASG